MLEEHLGQVVSAWFGEHDLPPDAWAELDPYTDSMRLGLVQDGDLDAFRRGLELLLREPGLDLSCLNAGHSDYDDAEMREILGHVLARVGATLGVESADARADGLDWSERAEDWWVRRRVLHRVHTGETLRGIATAYGVPVELLLQRNPLLRRRYGPDAQLPAKERLVRVGPATVGGNLRPELAV